MAKEEIGFNVTVEGTEESISSFKDLKTAIKAAKDEQIAMSEKFGATSVEATNAAKKMAELKDKVDDLNDSSKNLQGSGFEMLKGGFAQVQEGLMNLDFDKVKMGLTAMGSGFVSMGKSAVASLTTIKGAIAATGIGLLVIALGTIYAYWDDIKGVVDGLTPELKKQNELAAERLKLADKALQDATLEENSLRLQGKTEKEILLIRSKRLETAIAEQITSIEVAEQTKKSQVEASQRNKDILKGMVDFISIPLTLLLGSIDKIGSLFGKSFGLMEGFRESVASFVFDPDQVAKDSQIEIDAQKLKLKQLQSQLAGYSLSINAIDTKASEDKKKLLDQASKNSKEAAEKEFQLQLELQGRLKELLTELIYDEQQKEEKILENKYVAERKDLVSKKASKELLAALDELYLKQKGDITDKYLQIEEDKEKEKNNKFESAQKEKIALQLSNLESGYQLELEQIENNDLLKLQKEQEHLDQIYQINIANAQLLGLNKIDLDNKYAKDKIALEKKIAAETKKIKQEEISKGLENVKNALQTGQNLSDLYFSIKSAKVKKGSKEEMDLAKQQFEMNKKFNLAMALINGVQSVLAITTVPDFTLGVASAIRIAASVTATAAGIAKIGSAQFEGGGGGGSIPDTSTSVSSASTAQAPSIYGPGQGQSTTFTGNQNNSFAPVKAYVVETENRSTTNRVNKLVSESTYG